MLRTALFAVSALLVVGCAASDDASPSTATAFKDARLIVGDGEAQMADLRSNLQQLEQETRTSRALIDRKWFDFDAVIKEVGTNPEDLFQWVKTNTGPLPYKGILKGAWGVLVERQGNTLDRSLLLVELLEQAGHIVELANASLSDEGVALAKNIMLESLNHQTTKVDLAGTDVTHSEQLERLAKLAGTSLNSALEDMRREGMEVRKELAQLEDEANKQTEALMDKVPLEGHSASPVFTEALRSLEDHWWVLVRTGSQVEAFDLFFDQHNKPLKELGYIRKEQVIHPSKELPDNLYHTVTFRVFADQRTSKGDEASDIALTHTVRTAQSRLQPIQLAYIALGNRIETEDLVTPSISKLRDILAKQDEWVPILQIGGEIVAQASIRANGSVNANARMPGQPAAAFMGNLLNSMHESTQRMSSSRDDQLAEVRLEIELTGGGDTVKRTRTLFDFRDHIAEALLGREKQKAERVRSEAERVNSVWEEEQAELNKKRQVCSDQSGVDLEDLWVLERGAVSDSWETIELLSELLKSDKCVDLTQALASASPKPTGKSPYRISSDTPDPVGLSEELRISRAAEFMTAQQFLILPFNVAEQYVLEELRVTALHYEKLLLKLVEDRSQYTQQAVLEEFLKSELPVTELLVFGMLRTQSSKTETFAIVQTNLVSLFVEMSFEQPHIITTRGIDIVANGVLPLLSDAEVSRRASTRQGVFDTLLENYLIAGEQPTGNIASQFQLDLDQNKTADWVAVALSSAPLGTQRLHDVGDKPLARSIVYSPTRIGDYSSSGSHWLVDLDTGETLGYSRDGRGQSAIGMIISIGNILAMGDTVIQLALCASDRVGRRRGSCDYLGCVWGMVHGLAGFPIMRYVGWGLGPGDAGALAFIGLVWNALGYTGGKTMNLFCPLFEEHL